MAITYDLILLLDNDTPDDQAAKVIAEVEQAINASGDLIEKKDWGNKTLAYPINHKDQAHYHYFKFSGDNELLGTINHNLKIAEGITRFRLIKSDAPKKSASSKEGKATN